MLNKALKILKKPSLILRKYWRKKQFNLKQLMIDYSKILLLNFLIHFESNKMEEDLSR